MTKGRIGKWFRTCEGCDLLLHKSDFTNGDIEVCRNCLGDYTPFLELKEVLPQGKVTRATQGAIGEIFVCADLLKRGAHIFRSVSPSCPCDIIAIFDNEIYRIEVKTGGITPNGTATYPKPKNDSYDILAVVFPGDEIKYIKKKQTTV